MAATIEEVLSGKATGTTFTLNTAAGTAVDDLLIAVQLSDFHDVANLPDPTPGTWTEINTADLGVDDLHLRAWLRLVTASGSNDVTFHPISDEDIGGYLYRYSGANTTTPIDDHAANVGAAASISHVASAVSPASSDAVLACVWGTGNGSYTSTPASMTQRANIDGSPFFEMIAADQTLASSGSTGTRTAEFDASRPWVALTIAVAAAGAASQDITPDPVTVTAAPGSLAIATAVTPAATTVTAAAGSLSVALGIAPDGPTVTATPGTVSLTVGIVPAAVTVTAAPGTMSLSVDLVPDSVTVTANPGSVTVTTAALQITPEPVTVTAAAGTLSLTVGITPAAVAVTAAPGTPALSLNIAPAGPTVNAAPGTLQVDQDIVPADVTVTAGAGTVTMTVGVTPAATIVTAGAGTLTVVQGLAIVLDAATVTAAPGAITTTIGMTPAATTVTAVPGAPTLDLAVTTTDPSVTVAAGSLTVTIGGPGITPEALAVAALPGSVTVRGAARPGWGSVPTRRDLAGAAVLDRARARTVCPNDHTPYETGPRGELYCPFDGFRPDRGW